MVSIIKNSVIEHIVIRCTCLCGQSSNGTLSPPLQDWDQPEYIPDPDAEKPEDWDDDMDGEWEPPMIPNPDYKGQF